MKPPHDATPGRDGSSGGRPLGISLAALERWFSASVLLRAQPLRVAQMRSEHDGALLRVHAEVAGGQPQPYPVQLMLQPGSLPRGQCPCAFAAHGRACKHQAALALAWRAATMAPVDAALEHADALAHAQRPREALAALEAAWRDHASHAGLEQRLLAAYERDGWEHEALRLRQAAFERHGGRTEYLALHRAAAGAGVALDPDALWAPLDAQTGRAEAVPVLQARLADSLAHAQPPFLYEIALVRGVMARMQPAQAVLWLAWLKVAHRRRPAWVQALAGLSSTPSRPKGLG